MIDLSAILSLITVVLLALGGYLIKLLGSTTKTAVETSAEEAAKATIRKLMFSEELAQELQKARGIERQELRYKSYGALWKELRPLAIYDVTDFKKENAEELSSKLSDWYFSECGGLLLTPQARDFYFALQDLLRIITSRDLAEWRADRSEVSAGEQSAILVDILKQHGAAEATKVLDYFSSEAFDDWQKKGRDLGKTWKDGITRLANNWRDLAEKERFVILQQVGSKLRSSLVIDLESRHR